MSIVPGEQMGVLFPQADVCFLYLSVFSFFDLVHSKLYSCITCSELRQCCALVVDIKGPIQRNNVKNGYDSATEQETTTHKLSLHQGHLDGESLNHLKLLQALIQQTLNLIPAGLLGQISLALHHHWKIVHSENTVHVILFIHVILVLLYLLLARKVYLLLFCFMGS